MHYVKAKNLGRFKELPIYTGNRTQYSKYFFKAWKWKLLAPGFIRISYYEEMITKNRLSIIG